MLNSSPLLEVVTQPLSKLGLGLSSFDSLGFAQNGRFGAGRIGPYRTAMQICPGVDWARPIKHAQRQNQQ